MHVLIKFKLLLILSQEHTVVSDNHQTCPGVQPRPCPCRLSERKKEKLSAFANVVGGNGIDAKTDNPLVVIFRQ